MICSNPYCRQSVLRYGLCKRHFNKATRDMSKLIDGIRIKGTPYRATPDKCIEGIYGDYKSKRRRNETNNK